MGKATIVSHIADGQYNILIEYDAGQIEARRAQLAALLVALDNRITNAETALATRQAELATATAKTELGIIQYNGGLITIEELTSYAAQEQASRRLVQLAQLQLDNLIADQTATTKELDRLTNDAPTSVPAVAFCADYTTDLSGVVGTAESLDGRTLIRGGWGGNTWDAQTDGILQTPDATTAGRWFVNWAQQPAWYREQPLYRIGTITATQFTANQCEVTLDAVQPRVFPNGGESFVDWNYGNFVLTATFDYMWNNMSVFRVGDRVLVRLVNQSWDDARVVGFAGPAGPRDGTRETFAAPYPQDSVYIIGGPGGVPTGVLDNTFTSDNQWDVSISSLGSLAVGSSCACTFEVVGEQLVVSATATPDSTNQYLVAFTLDPLTLLVDQRFGGFAYKFTSATASQPRVAVKTVDTTLERYNTITGSDAEQQAVGAATGRIMEYIRVELVVDPGMTTTFALDYLYV